MIEPRYASRVFFVLEKRVSISLNDSVISLFVMRYMRWELKANNTSHANILFDSDKILNLW